MDSLDIIYYIDGVRTIRTLNKQTLEYIPFLKGYTTFTNKNTIEIGRDIFIGVRLLNLIIDMVEGIQTNLRGYNNNDITLIIQKADEFIIDPKFIVYSDVDRFAIFFGLERFPRYYPRVIQNQTILDIEIKDDTVHDLQTLTNILKVDYINRRFYANHAMFMIQKLKPKDLNEKYIIETCEAIIRLNLPGIILIPIDKETFLSEYNKSFRISTNRRRTQIIEDI